MTAKSRVKKVRKKIKNLEKNDVSTQSRHIRWQDEPQPFFEHVGEVRDLVDEANAS